MSPVPSCFFIIILSVSQLSQQNNYCLGATPESRIDFFPYHHSKPSNSNIHPSIFSKMARPPDTDASALRDLKEIIRKQAAEIQELKKAAVATNKGSAAPAAGHGHGGGGDEVDVDNYLSTPFYSLAIKRVGWLSFFLCSLSLTAVIMNGFEHILAKQLELAYFVPLLAGHGGNTGGQTVGTVLSGMSKGSITRKDAFRVIAKEASSGIMVGLLLGSAIGPIAHYLGGISIPVSTVVFCTLPLLSTIAATLASSIPFMCSSLGLDPALISAPAMTTFVDVTGLLSYFLIARSVFKAFGLEL
jgi:cation transporter-like permease